MVPIAVGRSKAGSVSRARMCPRGLALVLGEVDRGVNAAPIQRHRDVMLDVLPKEQLVICSEDIEFLHRADWKTDARRSDLRSTGVLL